ncbi:MAG: N-acetylmuramoyl-L-alanine amidase [Leptospirales bacterium]|nr:N-acetylmuramoyl-L-alanine amidase [Leptospirales bacterium]
MKDYAPRRRSAKSTERSRQPPLLQSESSLAPAGLRHEREALLSRWTRRAPWILATLGLVAFAAIGARYYWRELRFRYIVVHHTVGVSGNLAYFRRIHMEERHWSDIAYHFVVNNGTYNTSMGEIEESNLWKERAPNHSTRIWYMNYFGIAVVMVGNFDRRPPPARQLDAAVGLLARLAREYDIPPDRIVGHREVQQTGCPGKYVDMVELRRLVAERLRNNAP